MQLQLPVTIKTDAVALTKLSFVNSVNMYEAQFMQKSFSN